MIADATHAHKATVARQEGTNGLHDGSCCFETSLTFLTVYILFQMPRAGVLQHSMGVFWLHWGIFRIDTQRSTFSSYGDEGKRTD